jgi:hypothetical protein
MDLSPLERKYTQRLFLIIRAGLYSSGCPLLLHIMPDRIQPIIVVLDSR